jgi:RNA methyltransferase, TrmH family
MMAAMRSPAPPPSLTSRANPRVTAVAALRDRRERDRQGLTVVDGAREVRRAIEAGAEVVEVFVCEALLAGPDARVALDALASSGTPTTTTTEPVFEKLAFGDRAEGLLAVMRVPDLSLERLELPADPLVVVIEGVEKPGNIGAVLRSADGAGADALVAASPRTDLFNPNAIRASAGAIFRVPLAAAPSETTLTWARAHGLRIVATRVDADRPYTDLDLRGPLAIVLGAEADGLTDAWSAPDIEAATIPMHGIADSLNVSVAAAVLLFEARRQRGRHTDSAD